MAALLRILNPRRRISRWPLKLVVFAIVLSAVLYPDPRLLVRNVRRWSRINELPEPDNPALQPWVEQVRAEIGDGRQPAEVLGEVEKFVKRAVPYEWDWVTWGVADYVPTIPEIMALHPVREDCDGRAVVAASILQKLGYDARLVSDTKHVWVWTPQGETMHPGGTKFIDVDHRPVPEGERPGYRINWAAVTDVPANLAYGVAVFPWLRELLLLAVFWLLLLQPTVRWPLALFGLLLLLDGWLILRVGCRNPWSTSAWAAFGAWLGWAHMAVAVLLMVAAAKPRRRSLARVA